MFKKRFHFSFFFPNHTFKSAVYVILYRLVNCYGLWAAAALIMLKLIAVAKKRFTLRLNQVYFSPVVRTIHISLAQHVLRNWLTGHA